MCVYEGGGTGVTSSPPTRGGASSGNFRETRYCGCKRSNLEFLSIKRSLRYFASPDDRKKYKEKTI
ncbi:MAG: hypothetical protein E3J87_03130 [Candidatus Cloacimonadota bacterium]|nr:MAG: hypothetical protein E3J87_03130 [Candidatus Cloacimonadota bacterium]